MHFECNVDNATLFVHRSSFIGNTANQTGGTMYLQVDGHLSNIFISESIVSYEILLTLVVLSTLTLLNTLTTMWSRFLTASSTTTVQQVNLTSVVERRVY